MNFLNLLSRLNLYKLKRAFGSPIDIYKLLSSTTDVRTGEAVIQTRVIHVKQAIVLPTVQIRKQLMRKMAAGTEASRDFTAAGSYDRSERKVIIDSRDTPGLRELTADDWIVFKARRYQIVEVECPDTDFTWLLTIRQQLGEVPQQTLSLKSDDLVSLTDSEGTN